MLEVSSKSQAVPGNIGSCLRGYAMAITGGSFCLLEDFRNFSGRGCCGQRTGFTVVSVGCQHV